MAIKTYFVDGDKGGVGKSFTAKAIADMLMQSERFRLPKKIDHVLVVDADASNMDVCGPGGFPKYDTVSGCTVQGSFFPISSAQQWVDAADQTFEVVQEWGDDSEGRVVFSLPAGAGLVIAGSAEVPALMKEMSAVHVWVIGTDISSVEALQARLENYPAFYARGFVVINLVHGPKEGFKHWLASDTRKQVLDSGWVEIELPVLTPSVATDLARTPFYLAERDKVSSTGKRLGMGSLVSLRTFRGVAGERLAAMERICAKWDADQGEAV